jgi:hypothetical protein
MTDTPPAHGTVFISIPALKQMIAWSLLCMHITQTKSEDFEIEMQDDGIVVRTLRGK